MKQLDKKWKTSLNGIMRNMETKQVDAAEVYQKQMRVWMIQSGFIAIFGIFLLWRASTLYDLLLSISRKEAMFAVATIAATLVLLMFVMLYYGGKLLIYGLFQRKFNPRLF